MLFNAALIVSRAPLAVVKRGRASRPIRLPVPLSDQILTGRVRISNATLMRARRFHRGPNLEHRNEWLRRRAPPLRMEGLKIAIAGASDLATGAATAARDLTTGAASAASRTVAQASTSAAAAASNAAMENLIPTSAASAAAALFGSSDAVTPPKTLALGAAWRDALCPAHRERTDLPGAARSEGLTMVVAEIGRAHV